MRGCYVAVIAVKEFSPAAGGIAGGGGRCERMRGPVDPRTVSGRSRDAQRQLTCYVSLTTCFGESCQSGVHEPNSTNTPSRSTSVAVIQPSACARATVQA